MEISEIIQITDILDRNLKNPKYADYKDKLEALKTCSESNNITLDNFLKKCEDFRFTTGEIFGSLYCVDKFIPGLIRYAIDKNSKYLIVLISNRIHEGLPSKSSYIVQEYLTKERNIGDFLNLAKDICDVRELIFDISKSAGIENNEMIKDELIKLGNNEYYVPVLKGFANSGNIDYFFEVLKDWEHNKKIIMSRAITWVINLIPCEKISIFVDVLIRTYNVKFSLVGLADTMTKHPNLMENTTTHFIVTIIHRSYYLAKNKKGMDFSYIDTLNKLFNEIINQIKNSKHEFKCVFDNPKEFAKMEKRYPENYDFYDEIQTYLSEGLRFQKFRILTADVEE